MNPIISCLPLWFRFQQCMKRFYLTGQWNPHLLNALKYAVSSSVTILGATHPSYSANLFNGDWPVMRVIWLISIIVSTLYTFSWDCKMDWGLFDPKAPKEHRFLRKDLMYRSKWIYYIAMFINLVLRFTWCLTLTPFDWKT
jgi:hypothetical protein